MSDWSPTPRRPLLNQGIFKFSEPETRVHHMSPLEQQRANDGTPITRTPPSAIKPLGPKLILNDFEAVNKGQDCAPEEKPKINPDEVVKSFLNF